MKQYFRFLLIVISSLIPFYSTTIMATPLVEKGVINLRDYDFSTGAPIKLTGELLFYWDKYIPYDELFSDVHTPELFSGQHTWNKKFKSGAKYPAEGKATVAVKILLPENTPTLAVRVDTVFTAYVLYANGIPIMAKGSPGYDKASTYPYISPDYALIKDPGKELVLSLHIANFHAESGGF